MTLQFITTTGKLYIVGAVIKQRRLFRPYASVCLLYFLFAFVVLVGYAAMNFAHLYTPFFVALCVLLILPYLYPLFKFLFVETLKSKVEIENIEAVTVTKDKCGLQETVILKLKSDRKKIYTFRVNEFQVEKFIAELLFLSSTAYVLNSYT